MSGAGAETSAMTAPVATPSPELPIKIVLLLAAAVFINFVDRGNLATASPLLKEELDLTNSQIGVLLSAFFWSYGPLQPVAGWLAQRFGVRYVLPAGLAIWATATALTGLATGFTLLLALRVLLGVGESATYPCNSALLAQRAPVHERGRANGLIAACQALGPVFGTLVGGLVMARFGWRAGFIAFGLVSLAWLLPWHAVTRGGVEIAAQAGTAHPMPYRALLLERAMWGASLGHLCHNYAYYFLLSWLPLFLVKAHGFSVPAMAEIGAGIYAVQAVSAVVTGWVSDRWIVAGATPNRVQKTLLVTAMVGVALTMMACAAAGPTLSVALLAAAAMFFGMTVPNIYAIAQTLGGHRAAGQWMGIQNLIGNLAGVLAPLITGFVVDRTDHYYWAFVIAALIALVGSLAFGVVIRRIEPVAWSEISSTPATGLE